MEDAAKLPAAAGACRHTAAMPTLNARALLFDLDGTLVDSRRNVEQMWRAWCEKESVDPEALLAVSEGRQGKSVVAEFAPHLDPVAEDEWIIQYQLDQTGDVDRVPGVRAMLDSLGTGDDGPRWAIVTSCTQAMATKRLDSADLPHPPLLVAADDISRSKPDPEGFEIAASRLQVADAADCLVFEDSAAGLRAAATAGMQAVAITSATRDTPTAEHAVADWTGVRIRRDESRWQVTF